MRSTPAIVMSVLAGMALAGCSETPATGTKNLDAHKADWSDKQKQAIDDPMNYRPDVDRTDVSGGDTKDFNKKAFNRDLKAWTLD